METHIQIFNLSQDKILPFPNSSVENCMALRLWLEQLAVDAETRNARVENLTPPAPRKASCKHLHSSRGSHCWLSVLPQVTIPQDQGLCWALSRESEPAAEMRPGPLPCSGLTWAGLERQQKSKAARPGWSVRDYLEMDSLSKPLCQIADSVKVKKSF